MSEPPAGRRPLKTRSAAWATWLGATVARARVSPNAISVAGIGFAAFGGALLASLRAGWVPGWLAFAGAAACIQLRLLCNMLDGLVAVEGGVKGKAGDLFNELPDRVEDSVLLAGAGWAAGDVQLGWLCAALAILTAYIRALGASLGQPQDFSGPGAKPQRMFLLTAGCIAALAYPGALLGSLWLIASATLLTAARRSVRLYRRLP